MGRVLNMFGMGRPRAAAALWGVRLICLACAALGRLPPYGACVYYDWHGPPDACGRSMGCVLNILGMGHPRAAAAPWSMRVICFAWAAQWLRPLYEACA